MKKNYHKFKLSGNSINKRGQTWSVDLVLGTLVFVLIIVTFYSLLSADRSSPVEGLNENANDVMDAFLKIGLIDPSTGELDEEAFMSLSHEDYESLKEMLGVEGDFCLIIERPDGTLLPLTDPENPGIIINSVGSDELSLNTNLCGDTLSIS
jgi:hypothetical protein